MRAVPETMPIVVRADTNTAAATDTTAPARWMSDVVVRLTRDPLLAAIEPSSGTPVQFAAVPRNATDALVLSPPTASPRALAALLVAASRAAAPADDAHELEPRTWSDAELRTVEGEPGDAPRRAALRAQIAARCGRLFDDPAVLPAFDAFLAAAVGEAAAR